MDRSDRHDLLVEFFRMAAEIGGGPMNGLACDRVRRRIEALEAKRLKTLPVTIEWLAMVPGPDDPVATGEVVAWRAKQ